jgi:hypothetical protein
MYKTASANAQRAGSSGATKYSAPRRMAGVVKPLKKQQKQKKQFTTERDLKARKRAAEKSAPMVARLKAKLLGRHDPSN